MAYYLLRVDATTTAGHLSFTLIVFWASLFYLNRFQGTVAE